MVEACSTIFTSCAAKAVELATINPMVAIGTSRRKDGNSFRQFRMENLPWRGIEVGGGIEGVPQPGSSMPCFGRLQ